MTLQLQSESEYYDMTNRVQVHQNGIDDSVRLNLSIQHKHVYIKKSKFIDLLS